MDESIQERMDLLGKLKYKLPAKDWNQRKTAIYQKFQKFAKVFRENLGDEAILQELQRIEEKFRK
jgi:hypothetical protein